MIHRLAIFTLVLCGAVVAQPVEQSTDGQASEQQPPSARQQKLSPTMRVVDRDWQYFSALSCEQLAAIVAHSDTEQALLARRNGECFKRYEAFLPQPVDR